MMVLTFLLTVLYLSSQTVKGAVNDSFIEELFGNDTTVNEIVATIVDLVMTLAAEPTDDEMYQLYDECVFAMLENYARRRRMAEVSGTQFELVSTEWDDDEKTFSMEIAFYTLDESQAVAMAVVAESDEFVSDFTSNVATNVGITISDMEVEADTMALTTSAPAESSDDSGDDVGTFNLFAVFTVICLASIFQ